MPRYRNHLPQLDDRLFLTDGGIETSIIFHQGIDLPYFAAFDLLGHGRGEKILSDYYLPYLDIAARHRSGFILESATWRANPDWAARLGYSLDALDAANRRAIDMLVALRDAHQAETGPVVISGCLGPRGDGYDPGQIMTHDDARRYHAVQIQSFAETEADMVAAITMTNVSEALGIALAARDHRMPVAISFTLETDGKLPTGQPLGEAIAAVDLASNHYPAYYMINCAHPTHFDGLFAHSAQWQTRVRGLRGNASRLSHAELDAADDLDEGNPEELGGQYAALRRALPSLNVLGGCCGTDHRHVSEIARAVA